MRYLESQTRPPDEVIISAPDASHVDPYEGRRFAVTHVFGPIGSTVQRNTALEMALGRADIVSFFDDDFIPADDYLAQVVEAFQTNPNWSVVMGHVVADGARGTGLDWEAGLAALRSATDSPQEPDVVEHVGAYGCNMSVRVSVVGKLRFDERLPLYGWLEDIDFTQPASPQWACRRVAARTRSALGGEVGGPGKRQAARIFAGDEPHLSGEEGDRTLFIRDGAHGPQHNRELDQEPMAGGACG